MMFKQVWEEAVFEAANEFNPRALCEKLDKAEAAIRARITGLAGRTNSFEERLALADALDTLRLLRKECDTRDSES